MKICTPLTAWLVSTSTSTATVNESGITQAWQSNQAIHLVKRSASQWSQKPDTIINGQYSQQYLGQWASIITRIVCNRCVVSNWSYSWPGLYPESRHTQVYNPHLDSNTRLWDAIVIWLLSAHGGGCTAVLITADWPVFPVGLDILGSCWPHPL